MSHIHQHTCLGARRNAREKAEAHAQNPGLFGPQKSRIEMASVMPKKEYTAAMPKQSVSVQEPMMKIERGKGRKGWQRRGWVERD